jgi:L-ascorbate metabolism protein UlaG (beta-lactamase superfamily)
MSRLPAPLDDLLGTVRQTRVNAGEIVLWPLGAAGYILKTELATILIDPFLGPSNPPDWIRCLPPAFDSMRIAELGPLAAVLLTHEHSDHADPVALAAIGTHTSATVYGPASCIAVARTAGVPANRCRVIGHDEELAVREARIAAVGMRDGGAAEAIGYVIETGAQTLLHCGDSVYFDGFVALGERWPINAVCISVARNPPGRSWYMDEVDAARAARDAKATTLIPQHFDLWQGLTLDPERVRIAAGWYCPGTRVIPARLGERITLERTN